MALTANRNVDHYVDQELRQYPVEAAKHIYKGALCGFSASGHVQPLAAGEKFAGLAYEESDNSAGADGDKKCRVFTLGDFALALAGAAQTNIGDPVYASADDTLTFTKSTNSYVGKCKDVTASGEIMLRIDTEAKPDAALTAKDAGNANSGDSATDDIIDNNRTRIEEIEAALQREGVLP